MVTFAVRAEDFAALTADKEWSRKLEDAKSMVAARQVVWDFCKAKGYKTRVLEVPAA